MKHLLLKFVRVKYNQKNELVRFDEDKNIPEDKDVNTDIYYCASMTLMEKMVIVKKDILSGSFGIITMYLNYVKKGYTAMATMHTQGLKILAHVLVRCFLLENIRQPYQRKTKNIHLHR